MNNLDDTIKNDADVLRHLSRAEFESALSYLERWGVIFSEVSRVTHSLSFRCVTLLRKDISTVEIHDFSYCLEYPMTKLPYDEVRREFFNKITEIIDTNYIALTNFFVENRTDFNTNCDSHKINNEGILIFQRNVSFESVDLVRENSPTLFLGLKEKFNGRWNDFPKYLEENINSYFVNVMDDELILYFYKDR